MFFGITDLWAYVVGAFLIVLLPGPNSLYVLTTAAQRGVGQGYRAASGVFVGDTVLMLLTAGGAASLLESQPVLYAIVRYAGAAYLGWMGLQMIWGAWKSWRSGPGMATAAETTVAETEPARSGNPFARALTISLLNPKAILFFVSFFVVFVDPSYATPALSFTILGSIVQVFSMLYLTALIFGGTYLAAQFRNRRRLSAGLTSGVGALFIGFGAKLATASLG
ncbi:leucine efflux protein LeuE [Nonomuraea sp. NN258]|uniref:leucine efflux protein LeuE n=1 Tax=Nonomuraea antri TaxID=2730852 RepID=UPI00156A65BE|nr:leucine efflux protein LeuE [Nonomuraea antri]NRQ40206.1 leucine efflux protein LeuE [Nonomuraea antri]